MKLPVWLSRIVFLEQYTHNQYINVGAYCIRLKRGAVSVSPEGVPYVSDGHRPSKRRTLTSPERVQYNTLRGYGVYGSVYRQLFFT